MNFNESNFNSYFSDSEKNGWVDKELIIFIFNNGTEY